MAIIAVNTCLSSLQNSLQKYQKLAADAPQFQVRTGATIGHIGQRRVEIIIGVCALGICLAWEEFLEGTFERYMCGAVTKANYSPTLLNPRFKTIVDAHKSLLGNQPYMSWSAKNTLTRAQLHFANGDPYDQAIKAIRSPLDNLVDVRNRFAHRSVHAQTMFHKVLRLELGYVPRGITPGRFLLSVHQKGLLGYQNYLDYFLQNLLIAAQSICP
jgi:hypothetical protein